MNNEPILQPVVLYQSRPVQKQVKNLRVGDVINGKEIYLLREMGASRMVHFRCEDKECWMKSAWVLVDTESPYEVAR